MVHMKSQIQSSQEEKQKVKALTGSGEQRCVISSFPFPISFYEAGGSSAWLTGCYLSLSTKRNQTFVTGKSGLMLYF